MAAYVARRGSESEANTPAAAFEAEAGGLVVAASDLDLGDIWEDENYSRELPIRNRTSADIHVLDFSVSCGCIAVEPRSLDVPAGQTTKVRLTLDLSKRMPWDLGVSERPLRQQVSPILSREEAYPGGWVLVGRVHSRVTLDALTVEFGDAPIHSQAAAPRKVVATTHVPVRELAVKARPPLADIQTSRDPADASRFFLAVSPKPSLPPGRLQFDLSVDVITPDEKRLPGAHMAVGGDMQPEVRAIPSRLLLGSRPVGQTAEATVVLQATRASKWTVDHIETESAHIEVQAVSAAGAPDGSAFRVRQSIEHEGDHASAVRFFLRKPGQEPTALSMEVVYHGEPAAQPTESEAKAK